MSESKHGRMTGEAFRVFQILSPEERIRAILSRRGPKNQRFESKFVEEECQLREVKTTSPTHCIAIFAFTVSAFWCNISGNLHGGAQAAMFDICTSLAIQAIAKQPNTGIRAELDSWINAGVSRVLSVNYLRPAPEGTELVMECEVVQVGQTMSLLKAVLKREKDGSIISTCDHTKAAVAAKPGFKL